MLSDKSVKYDYDIVYVRAPRVIKDKDGRERQAEIFLGGAVGHRARVPFDFGAPEERARSSMTSEAFAYVAGGAGAEETGAGPILMDPSGNRLLLAVAAGQTD